jgi:hypothetical protein
MRVLRAAVAGLALALAAFSGATSPSPSTPGDTSLAARLQREGRVETAVPSPSLAEWGRAVVETASRWAWNHLPGPRWLRSAGLWRGLGWLTLALALAVLTLAIRRVIGAVRRTRQGGVGAAAEVASPVPDTVRRPADAWWEACETELAAGRPRVALASLWWWLAESLAGSSARPSWTSRQLLGRTGRDDLRPIVGRLDSLLYGRGEVGVDRVQALAGELAERMQ